MRDLRLSQLAIELGADFIGMIHHASSPRFIDLSAMKVLCDQLPQGKRVGVVVQPVQETIDSLLNTGIDCIQIHLKDNSEQYLKTVKEVVGNRAQVWLAPKLPPEEAFPEHLFAYADQILLDTYSKDQHGGTGETGDWDRFRALKETYPTTPFILAGGLNQENICDAVDQSQTNFVDFSSGLEVSPGEKSEPLIRSFFKHLNENR